MAKEIAMPNIIEQARSIATEDADDLAVLQFLMQAAATAQLVKLRKLEESKVPIGIKALKRTVTDTIMKLPLYPPWISFSLINGAGSALTVWINDDADPLVEDMIEASESYDFNATYPIIHTLYLKATLGGSTTVRIYGKEGKQ